MNPDRSATFLMPAMLAVFVLTLGVYVVTMPRTITLEDAGLFQMICHNGGIGHPPGYPLFILACQSFLTLPFLPSGVVAGNLLSALFASGACAMLVLVSRQLFQNTSLSVALGLVYGLSSTFWSQAIIIEVYSLAVLLFLICLAICLEYHRTGKDACLYFLALWFGLALSNHWPLQGLVTPALMLIVGARWYALLRFLKSPRRLLITLGILLIGLSPYLSLFQRAPEYAIFGSIETWDQFVHHVTRAAYSDHSDLAGMADKFSYQKWLTLQTMHELTVPLALLSALGLVMSFRRLPVAISIALVFLYLGSTVFLNLLLGFEFNDHRQAIWKPYPVISYLALVLWLGVGVQWLANIAARSVSWLPSVIPVLLVVAVVLGNHPMVLVRDNDFAQTYGETLLRSVPANAVLFVEGDVGVGVAGYLHHIEGLRPDLELRSWNNLVFENRLVSPFSPLKEQAASRRAFIEAADRPVYSTIGHGEPGLSRGINFQLKVPTGFTCDGSLHDYIERLVALDLLGGLENGHERQLLFGLLLEFSRQHVALVTAGAATNPAEEVRILGLLEQTFAGKLATLELLLHVDSVLPHKTVLEQLVLATTQQLPEGASRRVAALVEEYSGRIALMAPSNPELGAAHLERSLSLNPQKDNTSVCPLILAYRELDRAADAANLLARSADSACES